MRKRGFTLLELLVAVAMMALLAGALYSSLYVGFRSREVATRAVEPYQRVAYAFTFMAQDLDSALPPSGILAGEFTGSLTEYGGTNGATNNSGSGSTSTSTPNASGGLSASSLNSSGDGLHAIGTDPSSVVVLAFFTSANVPMENENPNLPRETGADIRKVEFCIEKPEGAKRPVLLRRIYYNILPSKAPVPRDQILCRNVRSLYLRYYDGTQWYDSWDSKAQGDLLPIAVEATLTIELAANKNSLPGEALPVYKMTRFFKLPCGPTLDQLQSGGAQ